MCISCGFKLKISPTVTSDLVVTQRQVRGQSWGSWVCPIHLDYYQVAGTCISRVSMCLKVQNKYLLTDVTYSGVLVAC